jgi:hypothetical protein
VAFALMLATLAAAHPFARTGGAVGTWYGERLGRAGPPAGGPA